MNSKSWYDAHPGKRGEHLKRVINKLKIEVYSAYGGICKCCGMGKTEFLVLDHVNDDGFLERQRPSDGLRRSPNGQHSYRQARREGYPSRFQLLCHNCNHGKRIGVCRPGAQQCLSR